MDVSRASKKDIATRVKEKIFETNEAELTIGAAKKKLAQNQQLLDKTDASYVTLRRIDNACKEHKITGYRGLLIDQLDILESRFNAVIDIAGKAKLFSIIVDDLATAQRVLELNKQLKGGVVNIYPLETIGLVNKKDTKMPPASNDVRSMIEFVRLKAQADQRLSTLVHNIFSKVVMVKEYARAL